MSAFSHQGRVYFAACGRYVKIGFTTTLVQKRLDALLQGRLVRPVDLDPADTIWLLHSIPGCVMRDERRLHKLFAAHRDVGEWFRMTPAFLNHLERLQYVTYRAELLAFRRARASLKAAS